MEVPSKKASDASASLAISQTFLIPRVEVLQTLDMDDYLQATVDHILAQLFFKQSEFKKIPKFKEDQAINLP
ncbi:hypothetical protein J1605_022199 [Eschrichtius robustus]|uniref:Uncharacterized protein n=1 Tax=Eschrichtius robustus TaxID=9764 RepID=A0AB34HC86_ESCRO|nr:hypothetical protein J1605_022199 [Eschrichtius robustus]